MTTRDHALALDAADRLAPLRQQFHIPEGLVYLDGNSLGVLPRATAARVAQVVAQEWGEGLIGSWNSRRLDGPAAAHRRQDRAAGGRGRG
jgi:kynureninase